MTGSALLFAGRELKVASDGYATSVPSIRRTFGAPRPVSGHSDGRSPGSRVTALIRPSRTTSSGTFGCRARRSQLRGAAPSLYRLPYKVPEGHRRDVDHAADRPQASTCGRPANSEKAKAAELLRSSRGRDLARPAELVDYLPRQCYAGR